MGVWEKIKVKDIILLISDLVFWLKLDWLELFV